MEPDSAEPEMREGGIDALHHMSHREIGEALGIPRSTVAKIEYTAMAKIRERLRGHNRADYYD